MKIESVRPVPNYMEASYAAATAINSLQSNMRAHRPQDFHTSTQMPDHYDNRDRSLHAFQGFRNKISKLTF